MDKFYINYEECKIVGDILGDKNRRIVFFLHGAGKSNRKRFETLRHMLYAKGISSCAFDFIGHGETGGVLSESSLYHRTRQACKVIEHIRSTKPLSIVANSMSGYTSVKLLQLYDVENLILFVPAAYDKDAYMLPFNEVFTECIRKEKSYLNSDAWEILNSYKGKFMMVSAGNDAVIPGEVIDRYCESASNAKIKKIMTLKSSPHGILNYMEENREELQSILDAMVELLNGDGL